MPGRRVVIIGGGAGGAILANLLQPHGFEVTVIDRSVNHFFQPGNLWIAFKGVSPEKFLRPLPSLLKRGVKFVNDEVVSVDLNERRVVTKSSGSFSYDIVVLASGAELDYDAIPGHRELLERFGDFYSSPENAQKLWSRLTGLKEGSFVIGVADPIYKCPPGPHKGAFFASELFRSRGLAGKVKVVLAVPVPHAYPSKTIADIIEPEFRERGVELHTLFTVNEIDLQNNKLVSLEGEEVKFDVAAVIPPHRGPSYSAARRKLRMGQAT